MHLRTLSRSLAWLSALTWATHLTAQTGLTLDLVQSPAASGYFSTVVNDSFTAVGTTQVDEWSFEAETGDLVSARIEATVGNARPRLRIVNASNTVLSTVDGGTDGIAQIQAYRVTTPGTYRVRVYTEHAVSAYSMRVDLARGPDLESESNDTAATADDVTVAPAAGSFSFAVGGLLPASDTVGDVFSLGFAPAGSQLTASLNLASGALTSSDVSYTFIEQRAADRSLNFNNSTYATIPHNATFDAIETANAFTIEAWVYVRSFPSGWFPIFDKYETTGDWGWGLAIQNGGNGLSITNNNNVLSGTNTTPSTNAWHHVAAAYDHGANQLRFYVDGVLVSTKTSPGALKNTDGEPAYIGFSPSGGDEYADGLISEVRLWNRALTTTEIQANYAATNLVGNETNLVGLWRFDEGTGLNAADLTGNANNATLGGGDSARVPTWNVGAIRPVTTVAGTAFSRSITASAEVWLQVSASANRGLTGRYLFTGSLTDANALQVAGTSLPAEGDSSTALWQSFTIDFDDELDPAAANLLTNYDLRSAGADSTFGTSDDRVYTFNAPGYTGGTQVALALANGPLQPGAYRLTLGLGLRDRFGNPLATTYTRNFTISQLGSIRYENQSNNTVATATPLGTATPSVFGGDFTAAPTPSLTTGTSPYNVRSADLNGDGKADLVVTNYSVSTVSVFMGNGDGTFAAKVDYAAGSNSHDVRIADVNGDGNPDLVICSVSSDNVTVRINDGAGLFPTAVTLTGSDGPRYLTIADFNGDTKPDIATANYEGGRFSVWLNTTTGGTTSFAAVANTAVTGGGLHGIASGDVDGDGKIDLVVTSYASSNLFLYVGAGDGTFTLAQTVATGPNPSTVELVDLNNDGRLDAIASNFSQAQFRIHYGQVGGTFDAGVLAGDNGTTQYSTTTIDLNGDGLKDILQAQGNWISVIYQSTLGTFGSALRYQVGSTARSVAVADFNGDGLPDMAAVSDGTNTVRVFLGNAGSVLDGDPVASGFSVSAGRGTLSSSTDNDTWMFNAKAGDRVLIASETVGSPGSSSLFYDILDAFGSRITFFYGAGNGSGSLVFVAPYTGRFHVQVSDNNTYRGEYRIRVSLAPATWQLEGENNNAYTSSNTVAYTIVGAVRQAKVIGQMGGDDGADFFYYGNQAAGTTLRATLDYPTSNSLLGTLQIRNAAGTVVASVPAGENAITYVIPTGAAGAYHLGVDGTPKNLFSQYRLTLETEDSQAPVITADTLPVADATLTTIYDRFSLTFSEDMNAATVNDVANYEVRRAGTDGTFDTGDDELYPVALLSTYSSGLTASYRITNGPLRPGLYRITVKTTVRDTSLNGLAAPYVRQFTVADVAGYVLENQSNDTVATATVLSTPVPGSFAGDFTAGASLTTGTNASPYNVRSGDLNGDGKADLVVTNYTASTVSVFMGNGDGTFAAKVDYTGGNGTHDVRIADVNGDGKPDLVICNVSSDNVTVRINDGAGLFPTAVTLTGSDGPRYLTIADFNGDGKPDIATANYEGGRFSVWLNTTTGGTTSFAAVANTVVTGGGLHGIASGDVDGDGKIDLVVTSYASSNLFLYKGAGDGTFTLAQTVATGPNPSTVELADLNNDGRLDAIASNFSQAQFRVHLGQAGGTFDAGVLRGDNGTTQYSTTTVDLNGDGLKDILQAQGNWISVLYQQSGSLNFSVAHRYQVGSTNRSIAVADFNGDSLPDMAAVSDGTNTIRVFLGNTGSALPGDPTGSGYTVATGRGQVETSSDIDIWSFPAKVGEAVLIATTNPGAPGSSSLFWDIYRPDGSRYTFFYSSGSGGAGQIAFIADQSGTYTLRISDNNAFRGEYRFRVSTAAPGWQVEGEINNSIGAADAVSFVLDGTIRRAKFLGNLAGEDGGDYFALGNQAVGTTLRASLAYPTSNSLAGTLQFRNSAGTVVASAAAGVNTLSYTITAGNAGAYYLSVDGTPKDIFAQYRLSLETEDTLPPTITADTLPVADATLTTIYDRFSLTFSEDMNAATVNDVANYEVRRAGTDGTFDTGDDELYPVALLSTYSSGLTASYRITNGPLRPGLYRITVKTTVRDTSLNGLAAPYVRQFTVADVAGYVLENQSNDTVATATVLSTPVPGSFAGDFATGASLATGTNASPYNVRSGDLNGDGKADLVVTNYTASTVSVFMGNGDGTFAAKVDYTGGNGTHDVRIADVNGDTKPDLVICNVSSDNVTIRLNDGAGLFPTAVTLTGSDGPRYLAIADFNGDTKPDIATANYEGGRFSVWLNTTTGGTTSFGAVANTAVTGGGLHGIAAGDTDGDGKIDLVVTSYASSNLFLYKGAGDGTFTLAQTVATGPNPSTVELADLNNDGRLDAIASNFSQAQFRVHLGQAGGTFDAGVLRGDNGTTQYSTTTVDLNGDGLKDILQAQGNWISVLYQRPGTLLFSDPHRYQVGSTNRSIAVADFNGDSLPDMAAVSDGTNTIRVFLGNTGAALPGDPTGSGYTVATGRGQVDTSSDIDIWSFPAKVGEAVLIATTNPGSPGSSSLFWDIYRPDGSRYTYFYSNGSGGAGQIAFIADQAGTYTLRISDNNAFRGEYRFRVSVLPSVWQVEGETNNAVSQANAPAFAFQSGVRRALVAGSLAGDDAIDYFSFGNQAVGTTLTASLAYPASNTLAGTLQIRDSAGTLVASVGSGVNTVSYTIPSGASGAYYVGVDGTPKSELAQYRLTLETQDTQAPTIVADTFPTEGSTQSTFIRDFTLTFSEDLDPATVNSAASYEMRNAGADALFGTDDDVVSTISPLSTYASGLTTTLRVQAGALAPGLYRFTARTALLDTSANALAAEYIRNFIVTEVSGYSTEFEANDTIATAVPVALTSSQPNYFTGGGRGYLTGTGDLDYWSFNLAVGDRYYFVTENRVPGSSASLWWEIRNPAATVLLSTNSDTNGLYYSQIFTAATAGTHTLRVSYNNDYRGEYRFRLFVIRGDLQLEVEPNNSIATASTLTLAIDGNNRTGAAAGLSRTSGELDYYNLGSLTAGTTVFVSTRLPTGSTITPIVSVYNASNVLVAETNGGRPGDGVAQVPITTTGVYYALVRSGGTSGGILSDYVVDVLVVPTADVSFPNLQVTTFAALPATGLSSGQSTPVSFRVDNLGNLPTAAVTWLDRVVLSADNIYGNGDDIEIGVFPRTGPLATGANYTVSGNVTIPDGVSGTFYVIARTDHSNTVNEFVLEGDNEFVADPPIAITLSTYPDLRIEAAAVSEPDTLGARTISWNLANRGTGVAAAGFSERVIVRNTTTGVTLVNSLSTVSSALAVEGTLARTATFTATTPGLYSIEVVADALSERFEFNSSGHTAAENNNSGTAAFQIIRQFNVAVSADPTIAGTVTGGGTFAEATSRSVTATINSPYLFQGWFEGAFLRSNNLTYTFPLLSDRNLVARFALPSFVILTPVTPASSGFVSGGGTRSLGETVNLTATPAAGYLFSKWTEGVTDLGTANPLTFSVAANRTITANFIEANPSHAVTLATSPAGVATLAGTGSYNNGQSLLVSAPASVIQGDTEYLFQRWTLGGSALTTNREFTKTFTTLDGPSLAYVAVYTSRSLKPVVAAASATVASPVAPARPMQITVRFDRAMKVTVTPSITLTGGPIAPTIPVGGTWTTQLQLNDTYTTPAFSFAAGSDGTYAVNVSLAQDSSDRVMDPATNVLSITTDTVAPDAPTLVVANYTNSTATLTWSDYVAPSDLDTFRVFRQTATFNSLSGLTAISGTSTAARSFVLTGLSPDTDYFAAVVAVDRAGNVPATITPTLVRITSTVPPPVTVALTAPTLTSVRLSWSGYNTASLLGFSGFRVYRSETAFTDVTGLTPIATLPTSATSYDASGLDRTKTYYYAVVGYNRLDQQNNAVTPSVWRDPLALPITVALTLGGTELPELIVYSPVVIQGGGSLTIRPGTTLRFAPGAGITVESGRLIADGQPLAPIHFTAQADGTGAVAPGAWEGITLADATRTSTLRYAWVRYGKGLRTTGQPVTLDYFGALFNAGAGLDVSGGLSLTAQRLFLAGNTTGLEVGTGSQATVSNSVLKNNTTNARATGSGTITAASNWWGVTGVAINATLNGAVAATTPLANEPVLLTAHGLAGGLTRTSTREVTLQLAAMNASGYRLSENSAFPGVLFTDVPGSAGQGGNVHQVAPFSQAFTLSEGAGIKTVFLQLRTVTGTLGTPTPFNVEYVAGGPVIGTFNLAEGQTISRPFNLTASASSTLGIAALEFYVDDVLTLSSTTGSLAGVWDVRPLTPGLRRVKLLARDLSGSIATRELNVTVTPTPPPAPVITSPANAALVSAGTITVSGTAEAGSAIRLTRNATVVATTTATTGGTFSIAGVPLVEGANELVASAFDTAGSAPSPIVLVSLDSGPPAAVTLAAPVYDTASSRLRLSWNYAASGERPTQFRVVWHTAPFTSLAQATGQSALQSGTQYLFSGQPNGTYYFAIVGYDAAGNASALSNVLAAVYDATAPVFTVSFSRSSPVGPGNLVVTLQSDEDLAEIPTLRIRANGQPAPLAVTLTAVGARTWSGTYIVNELSATTGTAQVLVTGRDLVGNTFNNAIASPALAFDITRPTGALTLDKANPISTATTTPLAVSLKLSEPAKPGTTPLLRFQPPTGSLGTVSLTYRSDSDSWVGSVDLTSAMGSGTGTFLLNVSDAQDNTGTVLTAGEEIELYTGSTPPPPGAPSGLAVNPLAGGKLKLTWNAGENATSYNIYREAGAGGPPTTLLLGGVSGTTYEDLPATDGAYRYVVKSVRLAVESTTSTSVAGGVSDRLPPGAPQNVDAVLLSTGVRVTFTAPTGETPARYVVYRNGTAIRTLSTVQSIIDSPPRGVLTYAVAAQDTLGNETLVSATPIELFVGAVNNLRARARLTQGTVLTWQVTDNTAVGVNVYRNGAKLNATPLAATTFTDTVVLGDDELVYTVRAVNAASQESAPRLVTVEPFTTDLLLNLLGNGQQRPSSTGYFDTLTLNFTNRGTDAAIVPKTVRFQRGVTGDTGLDLSRPLTGSIAPGATFTAPFVVASPKVALADQVYTVTIETGGDDNTGVVAYEQSLALRAAGLPVSMIGVTTPQTPLAGGLATVRAEFFNRGGAPMDIVLARSNGTETGDVYVAVLDLDGNELNRHPVKGTFPGMVVLPDGRGYLRIDPESSRSIDIPEVLVPASLGERGAAQFRVVVDPVLNAIGSTVQLSTGPLTGTMTSTLANTPYYGTSSTAKPLYTNGESIVITGQILARGTDAPQANAAMKVGFAVGSFTWFENLTTDAAGNYTYTFRPPVGFSGKLNIWAAHPAIFDRLSQTVVEVYQLYVTPQTGEIRMSKNDTFEFAITLINPGDLSMTGFTGEFRAFTVGAGGVETPVNTVSGTVVSVVDKLTPRLRSQAILRLTSAEDAPDSCQIEFTMRSAEGASAKFRATLTLLPAVPILSVVSPEVGYVDASVNRGQITSRQITVENRGQRSLTNVRITPPATSWFSTDRVPEADGTLRLPDIPIGGSVTFGVAFTPPAGTPLGYTNDKLVIKGDGAVADFEIPLYALVTSAEKGNLLFTVENTLVQRVPGASVRLRNTTVNQEIGPFYTDANGQLTVSNISEGTWSWLLSAPGHQTRSGTVDVVAGQTTDVYAMVHRALVSVRFSVVPVPFTDRYEIKLEQTFETHVPFPVLVYDPPRYDFGNVTPGFETTAIYNLTNKGLVRIDDVQVRGTISGSISMTPLITYIPSLAPFETVQIPVKIKLLITAPSGTSGSSASKALAASVNTGSKLSAASGSGGGGFGCDEFGRPTNIPQLPSDAFGNFVDGSGAIQIPGCDSGAPSFADFVNGIAAIGALRACGDATCGNGIPAEVVAGALASMTVYSQLTGPLLAGGPLKILISYIGDQIKCLGQLFSAGSGGNGGGSGPGGGGGAYSSGSCCFVPGTPVLLADGTTIPIENLKEGMSLYADNAGGKSRVAEVVRLTSTGLRQLLVKGVGTYDTPRALSLNGEHRVWHARRGWVPSAGLVVGDWIRGENNALLEVVANDAVPGSHEVYSFHLEGDKAAYVGGVLVEDLCEGAYLNTLTDRTVSEVTK